MSYDPEKTTRLIRETDNAGPRATFAELERSNQLQAAHDEIERLKRVVTGAISARPVHEDHGG